MSEYVVGLCHVCEYSKNNKNFWSYIAQKRSLRLNIFKNVKLPNNLDLRYWNTKLNMEWIKDCPLPKNETFMRTEKI